MIKKIVTMCLCSLAAFAADGIMTTHSYPACKITCIQDAAMRHPSTLFFDVNKDSDFTQSADSYESSLNVFLYERDGKRYLIDAGNDQSRGSLHDKLAKLDIAPATIAGIFITHIHPDHVGGLLWNGKPLFTNATIYIAREEYETWQKDTKRAALAKYLQPCQKQIKLFEYGDSLQGNLLPLKKAGHTPGHTIYQFSTTGEGHDIAYFVGDILHAAELQFPHPTYCARYDSDPKAAVKARLSVFNETNYFGTLQVAPELFGAHFPFPGCVRIRKEQLAGKKIRYGFDSVKPLTQEGKQP